MYIQIVTGIMIFSPNQLLADENKIKSVHKVSENLILNSKYQNSSEEISGKILDDNHSPLPGVIVKVKGKPTTTQTNTTGSFKIKAQVGDILIFSYMGFENIELLVAKQNIGDIKLKPILNDLQEIVVVGYGTVKKSDLTGSVSRFTAKDLEQLPVTSIDQALQGKISGVQITQSSGSPGAGLSFVVRGGNSLGSNQPLIVLDGYPIDLGGGNLSLGANSETSPQPGTNPLANLNPNDIESVEVLKDASSTAIYGSRGANGVVIITTKRGKNTKDELAFNFRSDISNILKTIPVLSTKDFVEFANEGAKNDGLDSVYKASEIEGLLEINNNWQDQIYKTGLAENYQLSMSGGEDKGKYYLAGFYNKMDGIMRNSGFNNGGIRFNYDRKLSKKLTVKLNVNSSKSISNLGLNSSPTGLVSANAVASALFFRPFIRGYNDLGETDQTVTDNPITVVNLQKDVRESNLVSGNFVADLKLINDLVLRTNFGAYSTSGSRMAYSPRGTYIGNQFNGYSYRGETNRFNYVSEFTLNYKKIIGKNSLDAVAGYTWQKWDQRGLGTSTTGFANDNLTYESLQSGNSPGVTSTSHQSWALASYLGRVNYTIDNKYLFTFTGRTDGSTRLSEGNKWTFFPSVAFGWKVNEESFFNLESINTLKLRASYGVSGNQNIAVGATQATLGTDAYVINGAISKGYIQNNMANPVLGWETTQQYNLGGDFGFLNDRILFTVEFYKKKTRDLLISLPIPASTGFTRFVSNAGSVQNKGLEMDLTANILNQKLKWTTSGNVSFNRNRMLSLGPLGDEGSIYGPNYLTAGSLLGQPIHVARVNKPVGSFYGYRIDGIYQNVQEVADGPERTTAKPGDYKFVDLNNDGIITADDREIIGNPNPDYIFGLTNNFSYKQLSFSFFIQGVIGNDLINLNRFRLDALSGNVYNVSQEAYDNRWRGEGTSNKYPRAKTGAAYFNNRFSDFIVEDGSFVRLKNVNIAYSLPVKNSKWIKNAKVFMTATNLLTLTNYSGYDPEVNANFDSALTQGVDNGSYPQVRTFTFGVNCKF